MDETDTGAAPVLNTVADAMAELERREAARKAERKGEQRKPARQARASDADAGDGDEVDADDPEQDKRKVRAEDREDDDGEDKPAKKPAKAAKAEKEPEADDDESDDDEADDGEGDTEDIEASDDADEGDDDGEADEEKPARVKVRVAGREVEATPDEISQHIERANAEVAQVRAEREHFETRRQEIQQGLQQHAQQMQAQGQFWASVAQRLIGQPPNPQLAHTNPSQFVQERADYEARTQFLQQILHANRQQSEAAARQAHAEQQAAKAQAQQRGRAFLHQALPDLADQTKGPALTGRLVKVAQDHGFPPEMLREVLHPGFMVLLHKAMRADDMDAQRSRTREKLARAPAIEAPEQGASAGQRAASNASKAKAKKAFMNSARSMRDVERYLRATSR